MPGLSMSCNNIREYLFGLTNYMLDNYDVEIIRRFCNVNPLSILKIHHEYDDYEEYF
jgi:hypothetical protein